MSRRAFVVLLLFLSFSFAFSDKRGKILFLIGKVLRVHHWHFLDKGYNERIGSMAYYLARNGQFTMVSDEFDVGFCKTHGTIIVTQLSFLWMLALIKADAPECTWLIMSPFNVEWLEELPPLRSMVLLYDEQATGTTLTLVQKPCWKCPLLTKYIEVEDLDSYGLESFFSIKPDFLNNSIVDVSIDVELEIEDCDPYPIHDPILLSQCYNLEIIDMVSTKIKFRPNRIPPMFPEHPYHFPNGSFGGFFRQLSERSIDMSAASLVVAKDRMNSCESVWPTFEYKVTFFVKAGQEEIIWLVYFYPFDKKIWFAIFGVIAAASLALIFITYYIRYQNQQLHFFILFPVFYILQVLCLQSLVKIPNLISSRIAYISVLIAAAVILPAYSGSLVSFLTTSKQHYPFTTLEEFIADGRFQILTRTHHFLTNHLLESEMKNLTSLMLPEEERVTESQDGFSKLCNGWLAYIIENFVYTPLVQNYPCRITETPVTYLTEYLSISMPKNFPLTEQMRIGTIQARSSGIRDCWEKFIIYETRPIKMEKDFLPVTLHHVAPMFVILFIFILLAWFILWFEVMHYEAVFKRV